MLKGVGRMKALKVRQQCPFCGQWQPAEVSMQWRNICVECKEQYSVPFKVMGFICEERSGEER